jgi:hypothetical protein
MSKPLWSIDIGDLSFDGPRLPPAAFLVGMLVGAAAAALVVWWL